MPTTWTSETASKEKARQGVRGNLTLTSPDGAIRGGYPPAGAALSHVACPVGLFVVSARGRIQWRSIQLRLP